jgi:hypothetical protein
MLGELRVESLAHELPRREVRRKVRSQLVPWELELRAVTVARWPRRWPHSGAELA